MVQIELSPGRVGDNSVKAFILGPDGGITPSRNSTSRFTLPEQRIGPFDAELIDEGGRWATDGLTLPSRHLDHEGDPPHDGL